MVENATGDTWRNIRHELDRMHLVTLATADGHVAQRSTTTAGQKTILTALELPEPPRFFDFTVPSRLTRLRRRPDEACSNTTPSRHFGVSAGHKAHSAPRVLMIFGSPVRRCSPHAILTVTRATAVKKGAVAGDREAVIALTVPRTAPPARHPGPDPARTGARPHARWSWMATATPTPSPHLPLPPPLHRPP